MRTVDPEQHALRRAHILGAAAECFAANGFAKTTTAQICTAAGVSSGSLFHYFPTKGAVFSAIFEDDGVEVDEFFAQPTDDPLQRVLDWIDRCAEDSRSPLLAGLMAAVVERANTDADFATLVTDNEIRTRDGIATLLEQAEAAEQIAAQTDPLRTASWILVLIDGLYSRLTDLNYPIDNQTADLKHLIRQLTAAR